MLLAKVVRAYPWQQADWSLGYPTDSLGLPPPCIPPATTAALTTPTIQLRRRIMSYPKQDIAKLHLLLTDWLTTLS
jgi:hypothetical protein